MDLPGRRFSGQSVAVGSPIPRYHLRRRLDEVPERPGAGNATRALKNRPAPPRAPVPIRVGERSFRPSSVDPPATRSGYPRCDRAFPQGPPAESRCRGAVTPHPITKFLESRQYGRAHGPFGCANESNILRLAFSFGHPQTAAPGAPAIGGSADGDDFGMLSPRCCPRGFPRESAGAFFLFSPGIRPQAIHPHRLGPVAVRSPLMSRADAICHLAWKSPLHFNRNSRLVASTEPRSAVLLIAFHPTGLTAGFPE